MGITNLIMNRIDTKADKKGFTLIELLIVIGIIGFLAAAVLVAVDPVRRIQDARDARRSAEVNGLLNALLNKQVDDRQLYNGETGALVITSSTNAQVIVSSHTGVVCNSQTTRPGCNKTLDTAAANTACVANLSGLVPTYIAEIPTDPRGAGQVFCSTASGCTTLGDLGLGTTNSGYYIQRTTGNRIEIGSCKPEQASTISIKR